MARRTRSIAKDPDARYIAVIGGVEHPYKTRAGAVALIVDEVERWIRWARFYDSGAVQALSAVRDEIQSANRSTEWTFEIAGLPARCGLRVP